MTKVKFQYDAYLKKTKSQSPPKTIGQTIDLDSKDANKVIQDIRKIIAEKLQADYPYTTAADIFSVRKI